MHQAALSGATFVGVATIAGLVGFLIAYCFKSALGIDIFTADHLHDILTSSCFSESDQAVTAQVSAMIRESDRSLAEGGSLGR